MFNLDQAITEWRRQMLAAGIKTPVLLDELESHLRDEVEQRMKSGLNAQEAFDIAVRQFGQASVLKAEFAKVGKASGVIQKLMRFACIVLVGFILWLSGFTFSQMQMNLAEQILAYTAVIFSLVAACGWRYAVPLLPVISNKRKRMTVGCACILSGFLCASFLCNVVWPLFEHDHDGLLPAVGLWAVLPIAVLSCLGLGLMMSARDRKYWGMEKTAGRLTEA